MEPVPQQQKLGVLTSGCQGSSQKRGILYFLSCFSIIIKNQLILGTLGFQRGLDAIPGQGIWIPYAATKT